MKKEPSLIVGTKGELNSDKNLHGIFYNPFPIEKIEKRIEELSYFTPSIEDIRVGYECEANTYNLPFDGVKSWKSYKFQQQDFNVPIKHLPEYIRTPYLTKEQIQAEGWKLLKKVEIANKVRYSDNNFLYFSKGDLLPSSESFSKFNLRYKMDTHEIHIISKMRISNDFKSYIKVPTFYGKCPSINEFRIISKLLGI